MYMSEGWKERELPVLVMLHLLRTAVLLAGHLSLLTIDPIDLLRVTNEFASNPALRVADPSCLLDDSSRTPCTALLRLHPSLSSGVARSMPGCPALLEQ